MRHYLITRFNVRVTQWRDTDKHGAKILSPAWMEHRFNLFDTYTYPSVMRQRDKRFVWIVLFDIKTSQRWLKKIGEYNFIPLFCTENYLKELQNFIEPYSWIITTRLDNDDAIEPDFTRIVRENAQKREHFINIPNGMVLRDKKVYPINHQHNPFMSFIENRSTKTIYHTPHGKAMTGIAPVIQLAEVGRQWTQVIHERNYLNE